MKNSILHYSTTMNLTVEADGLKIYYKWYKLAWDISSSLIIILLVALKYINHLEKISWDINVQTRLPTKKFVFQSNMYPAIKFIDKNRLWLNNFSKSSMVENIVRANSN